MGKSPIIATITCTDTVESTDPVDLIVQWRSRPGQTGSELRDLVAAATEELTSVDRA